MKRTLIPNQEVIADYIIMTYIIPINIPAIDDLSDQIQMIVFRIILDTRVDPLLTAAEHRRLSELVTANELIRKKIIRRISNPISS